MSSETPIDDLATWVQAYRQANEHAAAWKETADAAKQKITELLEERGAEVGTVGGKPAVRYKPVTSSRLNTKQLREDHPDIAAAYTSQQTSRRFTVVTD